MKKKTERVVIEPLAKFDGEDVTQEQPFKVLVIAPLTTKKNPGVKRPRVVTTTGHTSVGHLIADMQPELSIDVENKLGGGSQRPGGEGPRMIHLNMTVREMEGFTPAGIERALAECVTEFREKRAILNKLTNFHAKSMNSKDLEGLDEWLDDAGLRDVLAQAGEARKGNS